MLASVGVLWWWQQGWGAMFPTLGNSRPFLRPILLLMVCWTLAARSSCFEWCLRPSLFWQLSSMTHFMLLFAMFRALISMSVYVVFQSHLLAFYVILEPDFIYIYASFCSEQSLMNMLFQWRSVLVHGIVIAQTVLHVDDKLSIYNFLRGHCNSCGMRTLILPIF